MMSGLCVYLVKAIYCVFSQMKVMVCLFDDELSLLIVCQWLTSEDENNKASGVNCSFNLDVLQFTMKSFHLFFVSAPSHRLPCC